MTNTNSDDGPIHKDIPPLLASINKSQKMIAYSTATLAVSGAIYVIFQLFICGCGG